MNDASGGRQRHPAWRELVFGSALLSNPQHTATPTNGEYIPAIHGHPHCREGGRREVSSSLSSVLTLISLEASWLAGACVAFNHM